MPYSSSLFTFLGEQLRQPTWWAAIASLGFHGMLGASTPVISVFYPPQKPPGKVEVVQLTPAEMSRLPQISPAQISPPKFSLSPIPAPPNVIPPLPPGPSDLQFPSLPPGMSSFPPPRPSLPPLDSPPPSNDIPVTPTRNKPLPINQSPPPQPQQNPPPDNGMQQGTPLPPPPTPNPNGDMASNGGSSSSNQPGAKSRAPKSWDQSVARVDRNAGQRPKTSNEILNELRNQNPSTSPPTNERQPPELSNESSQTLEANKNSLIAYTQMAEDFKNGGYSDLQTTKVITVDTPYPKAACSGKLKGIAVLGVLVKPEGEIQARPRVLTSTNQPILDNAALAAVRIYPFEPASNFKLYHLKVEFKYDREICASPSVDSPTQPTPTPPAQPTPIPPAQPTPTPPAQPTPTPPAQPTPTPPAQPTPTPPAQPTPTPPAQPTPTPPAQPTPTPPAQPTPEPSVSPTPEPATQPTPEPSASPTPETSPTPTPEPSASPTPETSPTPTPESSVSPTPETTEN